VFFCCADSTRLLSKTASDPIASFSGEKEEYFFPQTSTMVEEYANLEEVRNEKIITIIYDHDKYITWGMCH
jgi:hypothetical protein